MIATKWLRSFALVAVLALFAAACNGDNGEVADDPSPDETPENGDAAGNGDGVLRLGWILPLTGELAVFGPAMQAAFEMAVSDINEAGGVLGNPVEADGGDEANDAAVASSTADRLLADGSDAIVGAAGSPMTMAIIDQVTGAQVVECSGSNTGPNLTNYSHGGYFFRTAPSDALQGPVLAETILGDGHTRVALIAQTGEYGEGLLGTTRDALVEQGAEVVAEILYDPQTTSFAGEVQQLQAADPQAVAIVSYEEGALLLQEMTEAGLGVDSIGIYGGDGLRSTELAATVDPNNPAVLDGMKGTAPSPDADPDWVSRLLEANPDLTETTYAAHKYDCAVIIALAAVSAGSDDPSVFVDHVIDVTREGTVCNSFADCVELLENGEDIDYEGPSGTSEFTDSGEPGVGTYEIWAIDAEGTLTTIDTVESRLS